MLSRVNDTRNGCVTLPPKRFFVLFHFLVETVFLHEHIPFLVASDDSRKPFLTGGRGWPPYGPGPLLLVPLEVIRTLLESFRHSPYIVATFLGCFSNMTRKT